LGDRADCDSSNESTFLGNEAAELGHDLPLASDRRLVQFYGREYESPTSEYDRMWFITNAEGDTFFIDHTVAVRTSFSSKLPLTYFSSLILLLRSGSYSEMASCKSSVPAYQNPFKIR
jgi:hypothetical protein